MRRKPEFNAQTQQAQFAIHMHILQREDATFFNQKEALKCVLEAQRETFWV